MTSNYIKLALILLFPLFLILSQELPPNVYTYPPRTYDAHHQIFCAEYIKNKGIWALGTANVVILFDGENFERIQIKPGIYVSSMASTEHSDTLWIGGLGDFGFIAPNNYGKLTFYSLLHLVPDSLRDFNIIWRTHIINDTLVTFTAHSYIYVYSIPNKKITIIKPPENDEFYRSYSIGNKQLWVQTQKSKTLHELNFSNNELKMIEWSNRLNKTNISSIQLHPKGYLIITRDNGIFLYKIKEDSLIQYGDNTIQEISKHLFYSACTAKDNYYLIGTGLNGLYILNKDGQILFNISKNEGLNDRYVWDIKYTFDKEASLICTDNGFAIMPFPTYLHTIKEGSKYNGNIHDILLIRKKSKVERVVFSTSQEIYWLDSKGVIGNVKGTKGRNFSLIIMDTNNILISGGNRGLLSWNVNKDSAKVIDKISAYCIDIYYPYVVVGGRDGLKMYKIKNGSLYSNQLPVKTPEEIVDVKIISGNDKKLYVIGGMITKGIILSQINGDTLIPYHHYSNAQLGLPEGHLFLFKSSNNLLITSTKGLFKGNVENDEIKVSPFCEYGNLFCSSNMAISHCAEDKQGNIWILATPDWSESFIVYKIKNKNETIQIDSLFSLALSIEVYTIEPDDEGGLWIGGIDGLAHFSPSRNENVFREFSAIIRSVKKFVKDTSGVEKDSIIWGGFGSPRFISIPYAHNNILFSFAAPYYYMQDRVLYRWKLEGFDEVWSQWSKKTEVKYTNLPPGKYKFIVEAKNTYEIISKKGIYEFEILPPWYRTIWAYILYVAVGLGTIITIVYLLNVRRKLLKQKKEYIKQIEIQNEKLKEYLKQISMQNDVMRDNLNYGAALQKAVMPSIDRIKSILPEHFILHIPMGVVSGDFYWGMENEGRKYFGLFDSTGHGVPGALLSMMGMAFLKDAVLSEIVEPGKIFDKIRKDIIDMFQIRHGEERRTLIGKETIDGCLLLMNNGKIWYSSAKIGPVIVRNGKVIPLLYHKESIGYKEEEMITPFPTIELPIEKGDMIYLFTDGYMTQLGGLSRGLKRERQYGRKNFYELLSKICDKSLEEQKKILEEELWNWKGGGELNDDVTVIGIRIDGDIGQLMEAL